MKNASRLLLPATLALLLPAGESAGSAPQQVSDPTPPSSAQWAHNNRASDSSAATYGELLTDLARKAADRAALAGDNELAMEAISELALRWLEMPEGATRVWDQHPRAAPAARKAVRNAQRSILRKERRHERIAQAAPTATETAPNQHAALELDELLQQVDERDRELILYSAQGMNAREIADELGISHGAARQRLSRARRQLRKQS